MVKYAVLVVCEVVVSFQSMPIESEPYTNRVVISLPGRITWPLVVAP